MPLTTFDKYALYTFFKIHCRLLKNHYQILFMRRWNSINDSKWTNIIIYTICSDSVPIQQIKFQTECSHSLCLPLFEMRVFGMCLFLKAGKDRFSIFCFSGVQRHVCTELCIKSEGNPTSGTTEAENGRKTFLGSSSPKPLWDSFALRCLVEHNKSIGSLWGMGRPAITMQGCFQLCSCVRLQGQSSRPEP